MQYSKYQSQVDELAAKLIEYEGSIVALGYFNLLYINNINIKILITKF